MGWEVVDSHNLPTPEGSRHVSLSKYVGHFQYFSFYVCVESFKRLYRTKNCGDPWSPSSWTDTAYKRRSMTTQDKRRQAIFSILCVFTFGHTLKSSCVVFYMDWTIDKYWFKSKLKVAWDRYHFKMSDQKEINTFSPFLQCISKDLQSCALT